MVRGKVFHKHYFELHCSPFIKPCLGSIGMDRVISESFYKGTNLQRNCRKMTILWSFSYNTFLKFHGNKKFGSHNMTVLV